MFRKLTKWIPFPAKNKRRNKTYCLNQGWFSSESFQSLLTINLIPRFSVRWSKLADFSFRASNPYTCTSQFLTLVENMQWFHAQSKSQNRLNFLDRWKTGGGKLCYVKFEETSLLLSNIGMVKYFAWLLPRFFVNHCGVFLARSQLSDRTKHKQE